MKSEPTDHHYLVLETVFPFASHLCTLLHVRSVESITIEPLSGGLTNHTVRALFMGPVRVPGSSTRHSSVIVKHAPPYIASLGPEHALSTKRQFIESLALALFSEAETGAKDLKLAELLCQHPTIRVPELLHHDEENHVLIMTDLGHVPTLQEYLTDHLDVFRPATTLGEFLSDLYSVTSNATHEALHPFQNDDSSRLVLDLVAPLPRRLLKCAGVSDADSLGESIEREMADEKQEPCFGMVDLWPGSVLVGDDFVGLVDWEYAGRSSAGSELGMLTAHLRIPLLSPIISINQSSAIATFIRTFLAAFAAHSPQRTSHFMRCALLAHGRELINAVEFQGAELAGERHKDALIQTGARCLRAAACEDRAQRERMLTEGDLFLLHDLL